MRILCVPNHGALSRGGRRLVNRHTGRFLVDVARATGRLVVAQPLVEVPEGDIVSDFDLLEHPELHSSARPWRLGSPRTRIASYLRAAPWILREVLAADFLYLFQPGRVPTLFALAARLLRRPYGVYVRGELVGREIDFVLRGAAFTIAVNEGLRAVAAKSCADTALARPMMDLCIEDVLDARPQRREGPWKLLFVGRVERPKGVDELIEACAQLAERGLDFHLDIVGGAPGSAAGVGGEIDRLRQKAEGCGLGARVKFHGMVSDRERLTAFYRAADLFVFPTRWEGFARVLYEAMANGLPVVTTFVGGIPAVVRDGENGVRIEVRDPADIATKVSALLADLPLRVRLAAEGAKTVREALGPARRPHAELLIAKLREHGMMP